MFEKYASKALHDRPYLLTMDNHRIDHSSNVFKGDVVDHLNVPGIHVDDDMSGVASGAERLHLGPETSESLYRCVDRAGELVKRKQAAAMHPKMPIFVENVRRQNAPILCSA